LDTSYKSTVVKPGDNILSDVSGELFEIQAEIEPVDNAVVGFMLRSVEMTYNDQEKMLKCGNKDTNLKTVKGSIKLHILIDRVSMEIFANDGKASLFWCSPRFAFNSLECFVRGGSANVHKMNVWRPSSVWS
jgi:sucrose-6-phosphate hydrolase SacC (GH32 family)